MIVNTENIEVNYRSDFDFILKLQNYDSSGNLVDMGFPECDFTILLYTSSYRKYIVSYNKEKDEYKNCKNVNNQLQIIANNHKLPEGNLIIDIYLSLPNESYPDKSKLVVCNSKTNIRLTSSETQCSKLYIDDIQIIVPYIKGDKGDPLTWEDMTEDNKNELYDAILVSLEDIILTAHSIDDTTDYEEIFDTTTI